MTPKQAEAFVEKNGIVLQAARGPVPSLAEAVAGGPIRGSWWGHARGQEIFQATEAIVDSPEVLVCRMIDGKVTYVHRRLWPALVNLRSRFTGDQLARVWSEHTPSGAHRTRRQPFPRWVPPEVLEKAKTMSREEAERQLGPWLALGKSGRRRGKRPTRKGD
jgi:hypothetical protein